MSADVIPYGALPGFNLNAEVRIMAATYGVSERAVRAGIGERGSLARHALFWRLRVERDVDAGRIAQWLRCTAKTVREGVAKHAHRIREFQSMHQMKASG